MRYLAVLGSISLLLAGCSGGDDEELRQELAESLRRIADAIVEELQSTNSPEVSTTVDLSQLTPGSMTEAGNLEIDAGEYVDHGDIRFTCAASGDNCEVMVMVDANGTITATSTGGMVTATSAFISPKYPPPAIWEVDYHEMFALLIELSTGANSTSLRVPGTISVVQPTSSGSEYVTLAQSYRDRHAYAIPWRDMSGQLNFEVAIDGEELPDIGPITHQGRSISTTTDVLDPIHNLGLNSQMGLQAFWVPKEYADDVYGGDGYLSVEVVTDVEVAEGPGRPWVGWGEGAPGQTILLDNVPRLRSGHDWQGILINPGDDPVVGSLDGVDGVFSCYGEQSCSLDTDRTETTERYYPGLGTVLFTPDDGGLSVMLPASSSSQVSTVDYLTFGSWGFEPTPLVDLEFYDFGVFAGGGDPFGYSNGVALSGSATYFGNALGRYSRRRVNLMDYYDNLSRDHSLLARSTAIPQLSLIRPDWSFVAQVNMTAEFETDSEMGTLSGRVYDFTDLRTDGILQPWPLDEIFLNKAAIGGSAVSALQMIAIGVTDAEASGESLDASGKWGAGFFGNHSNDPSVHPTSVAGTFGVGVLSQAEDEIFSEIFNVVGAFGAYRQ